MGMLCISRRSGETFTLDFGGKQAVVTLELTGNRIKVVIDADPSIVVSRPDGVIKERQDHAG